jgi:glucose-6-phosphate 1-dehydrogenase
MSTASDTTAPADLLVIFGISGDLAKVMTFRSLYRLERRRLLDCPIVGVAVDDWSDDELRRRARAAIEGTGETLDDAVFERFATRLRYLRGDLTDAGTYERLATSIGAVQSPVFYLEIPPSLFARVIAGLAGARLTDHARVVVEKPFGHDLESARQLAADIHEHLDESQLYRIDHFLGKMGLSEVLYLRFANAMFEPVWNRDHLACVQITLAERFGVETRGSFYDPVGALRDVVVNHLMQVVAATAMEPPAGADTATIKDASFAVLRSIRAADPERYVRGQYEGYRETPGVAAQSQTETYAALRLDIDNWRWAGVPFFLRAGKHMATTQTEVRLVFRHPPRLAFFRGGEHRPEPDQLVIRLDPSTGIELLLEAQRDEDAEPEQIRLDLDFAEAGDEGPTPYEVLLSAALRGDATRFTRQDGVEEAWRVMQPLLEDPPALHPYAEGSMGPEAADELLAGHGPWRGPWVSAAPPARDDPPRAR